MAMSHKDPGYRAWAARMGYACDSSFRDGAAEYVARWKKMGWRMEPRFERVGLFSWWSFTRQYLKGMGENITFSSSDNPNGAPSKGDPGYYEIEFKAGQKGMAWRIEGIFCILSLLFTLSLVVRWILAKLQVSLQRKLNYLDFNTYGDTYVLKEKVAKWQGIMDKGWVALLFVMLGISLFSLLYGRRFVEYLKNIFIPLLLFNDVNSLYQKLTDAVPAVIAMKKVLITIVMILLIAWIIYSLASAQWQNLIILVIAVVLLGYVKLIAFAALILMVFMNKKGYGLEFKTVGRYGEQGRKNKEAERRADRDFRNGGSNVRTEPSTGTIGTASKPRGASIYDTPVSREVSSEYGTSAPQSDTSGYERDIRNLEKEIDKLKEENKTLTEMINAEWNGRNNFGAREDTIKRTIANYEETIKINKRMIEDREKKIEKLKKLLHF